MRNRADTACGPSSTPGLRQSPIVEDVIAVCSKVNEFASEMAGLNVEFLEAHSLEKLLKSVSRLQPVLSGLETRILSQIETLAGDAEDTAQRVSKSSKTASRTKARRAKASAELPNTSQALDKGQITTDSPWVPRRLLTFE